MHTDKHSMNTPKWRGQRCPWPLNKTVSDQSGAMFFGKYSGSYSCVSPCDQGIPKAFTTLQYINSIKQLFVLTVRCIMCLNTVNLLCTGQIKQLLQTHVIWAYLLCKATSFIIGSCFLYAATKLRALSIQLPGRLCQDLAIPWSGILDS